MPSAGAGLRVRISKTNTKNRGAILLGHKIVQIMGSHFYNATISPGKGFGYYHPGSHKGPVEEEDACESNQKCLIYSQMQPPMS